MRWLECLDSLGQADADRVSGLKAALNNAYLASLATYTDAIPVFAEIFDTVEGDWPEFFRRVDALAALSEAERRVRVGQLMGDFARGFFLGPSR